MPEISLDDAGGAGEALAIAEIDGQLLDAQTLRDDTPDDPKAAEWKALTLSLLQSWLPKVPEGKNQTSTVRELCIQLHGVRAKLAGSLYRKDRASVLRIAEAEAFREAFRSQLLKLVAGVAVGVGVVSAVFAVTGVIQLREFKVDTKGDMRAVYDEYSKAAQEAKKSIVDDRAAVTSEAKATEEKMRAQREQLENKLGDAEKRLERLDEDVRKLVHEQAEQRWRPQIEGAVSDEKTKIGSKVSELVAGLKPAVSQAWEQERENFGERKERLTNLEAKSKDRLDELAKEQRELRLAIAASKETEARRERDITVRVDAARKQVTAIEAALALRRMGGERELGWILRFWWWGVGALAFSVLMSLVLAGMLSREQIVSLVRARSTKKKPT